MSSGSIDGNAFDEDRVAVDLGAEGDAGQDGELVRRVEPVDVEARIGLGVAELPAPPSSAAG